MPRLFCLCWDPLSIGVSAVSIARFLVASVLLHLHRRSFRRLPIPIVDHSDKPAYFPSKKRSAASCCYYMTYEKVLHAMSWCKVRC